MDYNASDKRSKMEMAAPWDQQWHCIVYTLGKKLRASNIWAVKLREISRIKQSFG